VTTGRQPLVTLTIWGVAPARIPAAVARMALDRRHLRGPGAPRFAKLLGTGDGRTFTVRDADPRHWGLLATWDDAAAADAFEKGPLHRGWAERAEETLDVRLRPLASRGRWSRREPFGDPEPERTGGPVASITRARIRPGKALTFWRAVPPVSADLTRERGPALAIGIGEAPIGLQGTFSLWHSNADLVAFARRPAHAAVVARTPETGWYAEELFARFAVLQVRGTFGGRTVVP
jgi:heme-degrading monooxygenase HmoA